MSKSESLLLGHFRTYDFRTEDSRVSISNKKLKIVFKTSRGHLLIQDSSRLSIAIPGFVSRKTAVEKNEARPAARAHLLDTSARASMFIISIIISSNSSSSSSSSNTS